MKAPRSLASQWTLLAVGWSLYYLAVFTVGTIEPLKRPIVWGAGAVIGAFTFRMMTRHVRYAQLPAEGGLLALFWVWLLAGGIFATNMGLFLHTAKMTLELLVIVVLVGTVLKFSGKANWFFAAFLGVAVWRTFTAGDTMAVEAGGFDFDLLTSKEGVIAQRFDGANAVGVYAAVGVMSMLALLGETRNLLWRILLLFAGGVALVGVVLSASRGAFVTLMAVAVLWPILCLSGSRLRTQAILGIPVVLLLAYWLFQFIVAHTYLGTRFVYGVHMEDGSTLARFDFFLLAFDLFLSNPLFGVGGGQFGPASGTGFEAHNELAEIISTTGLPGFLLYYSIYLMAWKRLNWSLGFIRDPADRYRINMTRVTLLILLTSGALFRPNYVKQDTIFLIAMVVGMAHWAEARAKGVLAPHPGLGAGAAGRPAAAPDPFPPPGFPRR